MARRVLAVVVVILVIVVVVITAARSSVASFRRQIDALSPEAGAVDRCIGSFRRGARPTQCGGRCDHHDACLPP